MIEEIFGQPIGIYDLDVPDELNQELVDFAYYCRDLASNHTGPSASLAKSSTRYADDESSYIGAHTFLFNRCHLFPSYPKSIIPIINEAVGSYFRESNYFSGLDYPYNIPFLDRAWSCIIRPNDNLKLHNHVASKLSLAYYPHKEVDAGNFYISNADINTFYKDITLIEKIHTIETMKSRLIVFPSFIYHWTDTNKSNSDRISYSFDYNTVGLTQTLPPIDLMEKLYSKITEELTLIGEI